MRVAETYDGGFRPPTHALGLPIVPRPAIHASPRSPTHAAEPRWPSHRCHDCTMDLNPISTIASAFVGAVTALSVNWLSGKSRRHDTLRQWRADAYAEFISEAHLAAHKLGRLAIERRGKELDADDNWNLDSSVRRRLRIIEMVASPELLEAANTLVAALREFRETVRRGAQYESRAYLAAYRPYQDARIEFARIARANLGIS